MSIESEAIQRAAAEFIGDRHRLGAFVNGLLRDSHAAEDVLQEVWVRLAAEVVKGTRLESQPAWCRGVARMLVLRHWERQKSAKVVADSAILEAFLERVEQAFAEPENATDEWAARQSALDECVSALPERSRRMLSLRYEERAPMDEVARAMGQTFDAVTKALYRVRQALLDCVARKLSQA
jgi:RNA polymerase sigma-70 factor (ECF subfamily)